MDNKEYAKNPACPKCGSELLEFTPQFEFGGSFVDQLVRCERCGAEHAAHYTLTGWEEL